MGATALASAILSLGLLLPSRVPTSRASSVAMTATVTGGEKSAAADQEEPLLLRAAKGLPVERPPVWMMRQAGRHMQVYRDLVKEYPTFRQRSEIAEVATEISLQPWRAYKTDGVILFSDILTPLPGMGIDFDILEKEGPKMPPLRTKEAIDAVTTNNDWEKACPFVKEVRARARACGGAV
jgi:uroporphyrinogen decarboxylase